VSDDPQLCLFCCSALRIAACHFPGQILEAAGLEQRLVELSAPRRDGRRREGRKKHAAS
jgi:hypothetical protein